MERIEPSIKCAFANDGVYGLQKLKNRHQQAPNIIFIDINMPRMNGIQCLAEIKRIPQLDEVPIYMYSTSAEQAIVKECMKLGATGFIKKEAELAQLERKFAQILSQLHKSF